jgi:hypothetical protein
VAQVVHCPAVFDDEKWYPLGVMPGEKDPYPKDQGECFYDPKDRIEGLFVAGSCLVIGDVLQKFSHEASLLGISEISLYRLVHHHQAGGQFLAEDAA